MSWVGFLFTGIFRFDDLLRLNRVSIDAEYTQGSSDDYVIPSWCALIHTASRSICVISDE